jgi:hypothetical protein
MKATPLVICQICGRIHEGYDNIIFVQLDRIKPICGNHSKEEIEAARKRSKEQRTIQMFLRC